MPNQRNTSNCNHYRQCQYINNLRLEKIFCKGQNMLRSICISPQCKAKTAILCEDQTCQNCSQTHQQCKMMKISHLLDKIIYKKQPVTQRLKKSVDKMAAMFDSAIEKMQQLRQQFLQQASLFGFSQLQIRFMSALHNQNFQKIVPTDVINIIRNIDTTYRWIADEYSVVKQWKKYEDSFSKQIDILKNFHIKKVHRLDSKITKDIKTLEYFFHDKSQDHRKLKYFNLLYRASQSGFSSKVFHQKCNGIESVMVLALTDKGKIIGGFNQIGWNNKYGVSQDPSNRSFLFSLSEKKKYPLLNQKTAIYDSKLSLSAGPAFGFNEVDLKQAKKFQGKNSDFFISNSPQKCYFNIGGSYGIEEQYEVMRHKLINQFTGNTDGSPQCRVKEWEVFEIV